MFGEKYFIRDEYILINLLQLFTTPPANIVEITTVNDETSAA
jgi:hypothetical protein